MVNEFWAESGKLFALVILWVWIWFIDSIKEISFLKILPTCQFLIILIIA